MHEPEHAAAIATATEAAEWHAGRERLAVTFERIVVAGDAAVASFVVDVSRRLIVGLERASSEWDALNSRVIGPDQRASRACGRASIVPAIGRSSPADSRPMARRGHPSHWPAISTLSR
jgi:hypothetical protein